MWHKVKSSVDFTQEEALAKKEGVMPDFNAKKSTSDREEVFLIKYRVLSYLNSYWESRYDMDKIF